jgi:hypothetical protein
MTRWQIAGAAAEQVEAAIEPRKQGPGREQLDAGGGELDGERQTVEPPADLRYGMRTVIIIEAYPGLERGRPLSEELDRRIGAHRGSRLTRGRIGRAQRRNGELTLHGESQREPTRHENLRVGARGGQHRDALRSAHEVLEIIQHEQDSPLAQMLDHGIEDRLLRVCRDGECLRDRRDDECGIDDGRERDVYHTIAELRAAARRRLDRERGLARSARTGQRQQTHIIVPQQRLELRQIVVAADQAQCTRGQVRARRATHAPERRERLLQTRGNDLIQMLRLQEILERVLPQVEQRNAGGQVVRDELPGGLRYDDLAPVRGRRDARRTMHIKADVTTSRHDGLARVQPHANAHDSIDRPRVRRQQALRGDGRRDRIARSLEREEETVAGRVDQIPGVLLEAAPHERTLVLEHTRIRRPDLLEQTGGPLDIGEDECDGAARADRVGWRVHKEL